MSAQPSLISSPPLSNNNNPTSTTLKRKPVPAGLAPHLAAFDRASPTMPESDIEGTSSSSRAPNKIDMAFAQTLSSSPSSGSSMRTTNGTMPIPPPRTSSNMGLGISSAPIELAAPIATPPPAVANARVHYLRAARSASKNGSQLSTSPSTSPLPSPVSGTFSESSNGASQRSMDLRFPSPPGDASSFFPADQHKSPLDHLKETDINKSLPGIPPPSVVGIGAPKKVKVPFSVDAPPSPMSLYEASQCYLTDEYGRPRRFGEFWDNLEIKQDPAILAQKKEAEDNYRRKEAKKARQAAEADQRSIRSAGTGSSARSGPLTSSPSTPTGRALSQLSRRDSTTSQSTVKRANGSVLTAKINEELKCGGEEHIIPGRRTVIFWIRHFWCGQCQDYTFASLSQLDPTTINAAGLNVIVISNGSWKIIKRYRELFNCPYPIYVDPSRKLYRVFGMTKMNNSPGTFKQSERAAYHQTHVPGQLAKAIYRGLFKLPKADPGKLTQLGGEFIVGPGLQCEFAHRMTNISNHMEASDVLDAAGCSSCTVPSAQARALAEEDLQTLAQLQQEEAEWREGRTDELRRIKAQKTERRGNAQYVGGNTNATRLSIVTDGNGADSRRASEATIDTIRGNATAEDEETEREDGGDEDEEDEEEDEEHEQRREEEDSIVITPHASQEEHFHTAPANGQTKPSYINASVLAGPHPDTINQHFNDIRRRSMLASGGSEETSYWIDTRGSADFSEDAFGYDHDAAGSFTDRSSYMGEDDAMSSRKLSKMTLATV